MSAAYAARRYRRFGIRSSVAGQSQVSTTAALRLVLGVVALVGAGAAWQAGLDAPVHALLLAAAAVLVIGVALVLLVRSERSRTWLAQSKVVT